MVILFNTFAVIILYFWLQLSQFDASPRWMFMEYHYLLWNWCIFTFKIASLEQKLGQSIICEKKSFQVSHKHLFWDYFCLTYILFNNSNHSVVWYEELWRTSNCDRKYQLKRQVVFARVSNPINDFLRSM